MSDDMNEKVARLTRRQREIIRLLSLGLTYDEIARVLGITFNTVDNHLARAKQTLGVSRSVILTRIAMQYGISPSGDKLTDEEERRSGRDRMQRVADNE